MPAASRPHAGGISRYAGRSTRRYKKTRAAFHEACRTHVNADGTIGAPCWLCGGPIDYSLVHPHPECFNLDHAYTVTDRPELAEDPANYRPSHKHCNEERGDNEPFIPLGSPSENW
jgi:hypothetical protein